MNRFLGPSGFHYGVKPDRNLQKDKLLRQLRQRFPHLSLYPHPAYNEPWLSPKHPPSAYAQVPYFPPGLQFPYVLLKGPSSKRARHVHYPLGIFQLRPWRFDMPLFNLRLTRRMRQGRFHNVFHHGKGGGAGRSIGGNLRNQLSLSQLAEVLSYRKSANAKLREHLWSDSSSGGQKGQGGWLLNRPEHVPFELEQTSAVVGKKRRAERTVDSDEEESPVVELKKGGRSGKSSPGSKSHDGKSVMTKHSKSSSGKPPANHPIKGSLKRTSNGNRIKSDLSQAGSDCEPAVQVAEETAIKNKVANNNRAEREALETIARNKKRKRRLEKERLRAEKEKRLAEQQYLKNLLIKSLKKSRTSREPVLKRTHSQKRRALYRKYRKTEKFTPEEEVEMSRHKEYLHRRALNLIKRRSTKHPKPFPFGNMPPKFQTTPGAENRFFWSEEGPELRNKANRDKSNIFRRHSEEILKGVTENEAVSDAPRHHPAVKQKEGKEGQTVASKKTPPPINMTTKLQVNTVASVADVRNSKLLTTSRGTVAEARSASPSALAHKASLNRIEEKKRTKPVANATPAAGKLQTTLSKIEPTEETKSKKPKRPKHLRKMRCQHSKTQDAIIHGIEEKAPPIRYPETFLEAREELMQLREKAWRMSVHRHARKLEERQAQLQLDRAEREKEVKKITYPIIEKPARKGPCNNASHLSVSTLPANTTVAHPKQLVQSLSMEPGAMVVPEGSKPFSWPKNRREAFRAYFAKHLLRLKATLVFKHRLAHANKDPLFDRWGRLLKTEIPLFDARNPYLVKIIRNLMRTKMGFRFKYETRAEEFLTNFPFVEYQTYRKFPVQRMSMHDRMKHYIRIKKLYRGQRLFKMQTPLRWYKSIKKNSLETPFDFQLYSDALEKFKRLSKNQNEHEKNEDDPGESYHQFGLYEVVCDHLKVPPFKSFQDQLANVIAGESHTIQLANANLTDAQIRPIAMSIMLSELVDHLDVSGNLLGPLGGRYIAGICGHTGNLTELNACNLQFDATGAELFYKCLRRPYCRITKLWLSNCDFGAECAKYIAGIIMENKSLVILDVSKNKLANVGNNDMIGLAIAENTVIRDLDLSHNGFSEKASLLIFTGATANTCLEVLNFSHNHVGENGCKGVMKMLEASDHIRSLNLEHCFLTDLGLKRVGMGIEKNLGSIERLILRDNPISGVGANYILKAAATKEKLKHVDLSLCPVDAAFVAAVTKVVAEREETFIDHTGDKPSQPLLPKYEIDFEAIALEKAKADVAKKAKKKK
ncbi:hypothetical protein BV898_09790 [Hypsibius exemplaris]|uniref:Uncharacterized protein n=1 Tax=Hypsibius exemplaris TaxID=2072580 RepID=A0A1W0WLD6_HYPEX|nr:hypothetical protein BV898_09790 [Hypsibius exemplaris]